MKVRTNPVPVERWAFPMAAGVTILELKLGRRQQTSWTLWWWEHYGEWPMLPADVLDDLIVYRRAHSCNNGSMDRDERKAVQSNGPWAC